MRTYSTLSFEAVYYESSAQCARTLHSSNAPALPVSRVPASVSDDVISLRRAAAVPRDAAVAEAEGRVGERLACNNACRTE